MYLSLTENFFFFVFFAFDFSFPSFTNPTKSTRSAVLVFSFVPDGHRRPVPYPSGGVTRPTPPNPPVPRPSPSPLPRATPTVHRPPTRCRGVRKSCKGELLGARGRHWAPPSTVDRHMSRHETLDPRVCSGRVGDWDRRGRFGGWGRMKLTEEPEVSGGSPMVPVVRKGPSVSVRRLLV